MGAYEAYYRRYTLDAFLKEMLSNILKDLEETADLLRAVMRLDDFTKKEKAETEAAVLDWMKTNASPEQARVFMRDYLFSVVPNSGQKILEYTSNASVLACIDVARQAIEGKKWETARELSEYAVLAQTSPRLMITIFELTVTLLEQMPKSEAGREKVIDTIHGYLQEPAVYKIPEVAAMEERAVMALRKAEKPLTPKGFARKLSMLGGAEAAIKGVAAKQKALPGKQLKLTHTG